MEQVSLIGLRAQRFLPDLKDLGAQQPIIHRLQQVVAKAKQALPQSRESLETLMHMGNTRILISMAFGSISAIIFWLRIFGLVELNRSSKSSFEGEGYLHLLQANIMSEVAKIILFAIIFQS